MAMGEYRGVSNVARKITKEHRGVSNVARQITKAYRGVSNVARQYFDYMMGNITLRFTKEEYSGSGKLEEGSFYAGVDGDTWRFSMNVTRADEEGRVARAHLEGIDFSGKTLSFEYTLTYRSDYCPSEVIYLSSEDTSKEDGNRIDVFQLRANSEWTSYSAVVPEGTTHIAIGIWIGYYDNETTLVLRNVCIDGENVMYL